MKVGQGVLAKIKYKSGTDESKLRPYLIVYVDSDKIKVLIVSSLAGKEHKLAYKSNYRLESFRPPFLRESFVKLDSQQEIDIEVAKKLKILSGGDILNQKDLYEILNRLKHYDK